jgi:hypothetical protein
MKSWTTRLALGLLLLAASVPAFADIPAPDSNRNKPAAQPKIKSSMHLQPDYQAKEARLLIPRDVLRQLQEAAGSDAPNSAAKTASAFNLNGTQTVVAGLFLSLAFVFGGVWLARTRATATDKLTRAALGVAVLALCGATASIAYANAGPPPVARSLTSKLLIQEAHAYGAYGEVTVEVVDEGKSITLVLPPK